jgi:hypothetical protein
MGQVLKPVQDLCRAMLAGKARKDPPTADEWEAWYQKAQTAATAMHRCTFVLMSAQKFGWSFARELDFFQESELLFDYVVCS